MESKTAEEPRQPFIFCMSGDGQESLCGAKNGLLVRVVDVAGTGLDVMAGQCWIMRGEWPQGSAICVACHKVRRAIYWGGGRLL